MGLGNRYAIGAIFEKPLNEDFSFEYKLGYYNLSAINSTIENTTIIQNGTSHKADIMHSIYTKLFSSGLSLGVKYNIWNKLFVSLGGKLDYIFGGEFNQKEEIINQPNIAFIDENGNYSKIRNAIDGHLVNMSRFNFSPYLQFSYKHILNLDSTLILEPKISYHFGLINLINDIEIPKWKLNSLNIGLSLRYRFNKIKESPKKLPIETIDTILIEKDLIAEDFYKLGIPHFINDDLFRTDTLFIKKKSNLTAQIKSFIIDENGNKRYDYSIKTEEITQSQYEPLLPYIFFEENSSELRKDYITLNNNETKNFDINQLFNQSSIEVYYNLLNIVAKRMLENPESNLTINGCNSSIEIENNNLILSKNRAETIKNYFIDVWEIDSNRIKLTFENLPKLASTPIDEIEKQQENRRVELYSDNPKILEPVYLEYINLVTNHNKIYFEPIITTDAKLSVYRISANQEGNTTSTFNYENSELRDSIEWNFEENPKTIPISNLPIYYTLQTEDINGNMKFTLPQKIYVEFISLKSKIINQIDNYKIDKFKLILFDFDKATLDEKNAFIVDFIKSKIEDESKVEIKGYTDRTGKAEYNKELSLKRAEIVYKALKKKDALYYGLGEEYPLFDNDLPEGRFYNRTIEIQIKTLLK